MPSIWDEKPELLAKLQEMLAQGIYAAQIARTLGHGISRGAVIGKSNRLRKASGIAPTPRPKSFVLPNMGHQSRNKTRTAPKPEPVEICLLEPLGPSDGDFPAPGLCRYPHGVLPPYKFCGHPGSPFCEFHQKLCYTPKTGKPSGKAFPGHADRTFR